MTILIIISGVFSAILATSCYFLSCEAKSYWAAYLFGAAALLLAIFSGFVWGFTLSEDIYQLLIWYIDEGLSQ